MTFDFDAVFNPTPEQMEQRREREKQIHNALIADRACDLCQKAVFEPRYEHGMPSGSYCFCSVTGKLREYPYATGKKCELWELRAEEATE